MKRKYHIHFQKVIQMIAMLSLLALLLYLLPSESQAIAEQQPDADTANMTIHFTRL